MSCTFCKDLPLRTVRQLNTDIEAGELSIAQIATNYGAEVPAIEAHVDNCILSTRSGYSMLVQLLDSITRVAAERKRTHEVSRKSDDAAMEHYIALVREARSTVLAMDKLKPSEELVKAITQQILAPMVNQCAFVTVDECNRLRDDVRSFVDPSLYARLDQSINIILRRIGARLKRETTELIPRLRKLLNVQDGAEQIDVILPDIDVDTDVQDPPIN